MSLVDIEVANKAFPAAQMRRKNTRNGPRSGSPCPYTDATNYAMWLARPPAILTAELCMSLLTECRKSDWAIAPAFFAVHRGRLPLRHGSPHPPSQARAAEDVFVTDEEAVRRTWAAAGEPAGGPGTRAARSVGGWATGGWRTTSST